MAHNDMQVVICKILTYLYECLKAGKFSPLYGDDPNKTFRKTKREDLIMIALCFSADNLSK